MKQHVIKHEHGQSMVIIVFALIGLIALLALVVDAGNAYIQRREIQNAYDAASQAGSVALANGLNVSGIQSAVVNYGSRNNVTIDPNKINVVLQDASGNKFLYANAQGTPVPINSFGGGNRIPPTMTVNSVVYDVAGIHAEGNQTFNTFFANIVGFKQGSIGGSSSTFVRCGACSSSGLFPIAIDPSTFASGGVPAVVTESSDTTGTFRYYLKENVSGTNYQFFSYAYWKPGNNIDSEMNGSQVSGTFFVTDTLSGDTNITANSDATIRSTLNSLIDNNTLVTAPVATHQYTGTNVIYTINGFVRLHIRCYKFGSYTHGTCLNTTDTKHIEATVVQWTDPQAGGGCSNYGICAITAGSTKREAIVTVTYNKVMLNNTPTTQTTHIPVDVALVLDLSSSMGWDFNGGGGTPTRLTSAVKAMRSFINTMVISNTANPSWGDQLSLVYFPQDSMDTQTAYTSICGTTQTKNEQATKKYDLGGTITWMKNISSTLGSASAHDNTPTAAGIKAARQILTGGNHKAGNTPVMIIGTDGRANVLVDTGKYSGDNVDALPCNYPAVMDMTNEASTAKSMGITIFVVAISDDYKSNANLTSMFPNMASPDTTVTQPHFLPAPNDTTMQNVYTQIVSRTETLQNECTTKTRPLPGAGALIELKKQGTDGQGSNYRSAVTNANGQAIFTDISDGVWVIQPTQVTDSQGIVYSVFTLGVGGMNLPYAPVIEVKTEPQTYPQDVFLSTPNPPNCP